MAEKNVEIKELLDALGVEQLWPYRTHERPSARYVRQLNYLETRRRTGATAEERLEQSDYRRGTYPEASNELLLAAYGPAPEDPEETEAGERLRTRSFSWIQEKMDGFAQTRAPDDLFDDEFTPITNPISQPIPASSASLSHAPQHPRADRSSGPRTQGRNVKPGQATREPLPADTTSDAPSGNESYKENEPHAQPPPQAVRGDRSGTGGIRKPKLTEDELSARLEAVKLNNAKREEAHRLAEADEASFQHREQQAQSKRREESAAKRVQDAEREKNRIRKLKAQGGREWDEDKVEHDPTDGRARAMALATATETRTKKGLDSQPGEAEDVEDAEGGEGEEGAVGTIQEVADFPALPGPAGKTGGLESKWAASTASEPVQSPSGEKGSWAEQVEAVAPDGGW
ncbi:MAG: hypothetical protein LQ347_004303 [Umbilicaria vellea]|nr:MAG: hypothetical protein LQ347_004303 [Umbilicaria vellea]